MKNIPFVLLAALSGFLSGCVTPQIKTSPPAAVAFHQFHQVRLILTDSVNTPFSKEGLPMFEGLLRGRLQSFGYTIVEADPELIMEVNIQQFDPGNRALRTVVGFGAGRAVLKYTARFEDASGKLRAELDGGKAYHGLEVVDNPTFKSDESTRMGLISYSVSQIGEFLESNGKQP